ncbi:MAG: amphi-Trp domain-containing protein [Candidatus Sumerlaeaceae bacterium]
MQKPKPRTRRDIEKAYPRARFIEKLRRLADALETGATFRIQVAGERITIPSNAVINIEHERTGDEEELEFQLKWSASSET